MTGATNVREAWIDHSTDTTRTQSRVSDVSKNVSDVDFRYVNLLFCLLLRALLQKEMINSKMNCDRKLSQNLVEFGSKTKSLVQFLDIN